MTIYDSSGALATKLIAKFMNEHKLSVEREIIISDGIGGGSSIWAEVYSDIDCAFIPLSGQERLELARLNHSATHNVYILPQITITEKDRIIFRGKRYDIRNIKNVAEGDAVLILSVDSGLS